MKLFVFLFFTTSLIAQEVHPESIPIYDQIYSQALSPKSENEVGLHQKFEIGVHLPDSIMKRINAFLYKYQTPTRLRINPFLEWEIDVQSTFTHLETNDSIAVDGFFYQDYTRNFDLNDWELKNSEFPFRVRFAPNKLGEWKQQVSITIKNQPTIYLSSSQFKVVASDSKGYVKVHPNAKNLQRNGEMIFPIGHNFIAPDEGVTSYHTTTNPHLAPDQMNKAADLGDWVNYIHEVENYLQEGGKYIRTIQAPWSSLIEFEEKGNYFNRLHYAWEQDNLIEICEKNDALVLFNFLLQEPFMNYGDYYFYDWDWDKYGYDKSHVPSDPYPVYGYNDNPGVKQPHEMFLLEDDLKYHEQRTRYYVSRYGYSTSIFEFELLSEPYHLDQHWSEGGTLEPSQVPRNAGFQLRTFLSGKPTLAHLGDPRSAALAAPLLLQPDLPDVRHRLHRRTDLGLLRAEGPDAPPPRHLRSLRPPRHPPRIGLHPRRATGGARGDEPRRQPAKNGGTPPGPAPLARPAPPHRGADPDELPPEHDSRIAPHRSRRKNGPG